MMEKLLSFLFPYKGMSLLCLKNNINAQNMMIPQTPVTMRTHLNAPGSSKKGMAKFMPNIPATTPKMATTNVAVVSSSSNWISWLRTLSCKPKFVHKFQISDTFPRLAQFKDAHRSIRNHNFSIYPITKEKIISSSSGGEGGAET